MLAVNSLEIPKIPTSWGSFCACSVASNAVGTLARWLSDRGTQDLPGAASSPLAHLSPRKRNETAIEHATREVVVPVISLCIDAPLGVFPE